MYTNSKLNPTTYIGERSPSAPQRTSEPDIPRGNERTSDRQVAIPRTNERQAHSLHDA